MANRFGRKRRRRMREEIERASLVAAAKDHALRQMEGEIAALRRILYAGLPEATADDTAPDLSDLPVRSRNTWIEERTDQFTNISVELVVAQDAWAQIKSLVYENLYRGKPRVRLDDKSLILTSVQHDPYHEDFAGRVCLVDRTFTLKLEAENRPAFPRRAAS